MSVELQIGQDLSISLWAFPFRAHQPSATAAPSVATVRPRAISVSTTVANAESSIVNIGWPSEKSALL